MHIPFSTIYLLQEQELNHMNYSEHEIIIRIFYKLLVMILTFTQKFNT
jgi:hypothetical protein